MIGLLPLAYLAFPQATTSPYDTARTPLSQVESFIESAHAENQGAGVIVGIVDSGIDVRHPAFLDASGHTRILFYNDRSMTTSASDPGTIYSQSDINSLLGDFTHIWDSDGHGTHVASIAAGCDASQCGIAPKASIVAVALSPDAVASDVVAGVQYVFDVADSLHMPAVVNLSLSLQNAAHTGDSGTDSALAAMLANPGHIIVAAAGNYAGTGIHTSFRLFGSMSVPFAASDDPISAYLSFSSGANPTFDLRDSAGNLYMGTVSPDQSFTSTPTSTTNVFATNGDIKYGSSNSAQFTISGASGSYWLDLTGDTNVDIWLTNATFSRGTVDLSTIAVPADSASILSVGCIAIDTRTRCPFSAMGPSSAGAFRPDVLAPGIGIIGALSSDALASFLADLEGQWMVVDDQHVALTGTSMSAGVVAGTIALLLADNPSLTESQAQGLLYAGAVAPAQTDSGTGAGSIDYAHVISARDGVAVDGAVTPRWVFSQPYVSDWGTPMSGLLLAQDSAGVGHDEDASVSFNCQSLTTTHAGPGAYSFQFTPSTGLTGSQSFSASLGGQSYSASLPAATDYWDATDPREATGSCSMRHYRRKLMESMWLLPLLLLGRRRKTHANMRG